VSDWIKDAAYQQWLDGFVARNPPISTSPPPLGFLMNLMRELGNLIQAEAVCVANGAETWSGALTAVTEYAATQAGALPKDQQDALDQLIVERLNDEISVAESGTHNRKTPVWDWILRGHSAE
jgi:hypothetical protein